MYISNRVILGKNSISVENEGNLSIIKRTISSFQHLILCAFLIFKDFLTSLLFKIISSDIN